MKHKRSLSIAMATIVLLSLCAVYATTSVSAVASNNILPITDKRVTNPVTKTVAAGTVSSEVGSITPNDKTVAAPVAAEATNTRDKATPDLAGSPIAAGTSPSNCVLYGSTSMYVFVKGYDSALWYRIWSIATYSWVGGWVSLGQTLDSSPAASSSTLSGSPHMIVCWRGTDAYVHFYEYYQGGFMGPGLTGGNLGYVSYGTGPGLALSPDRIDFFVRGSTQAMYQKTWSITGGWTDWTYRGGVLASSPSAGYRAGTTYPYLDVVIRGTNGAVYLTEYSFVSHTWFPFWYRGGGVMAGTGPGICTYGSTADSTSRMDIFVAGTNAMMYQIYWKMGSGWTGWTNLIGGLTTTPSAATFTYYGTIDIVVYVRGTNGLLYQKDYYTGVWHNWKPGIDGPP